MKRFLLLILGFAGSMLMVWALQESVKNTLTKEAFASVQAPQMPTGITLPVTVPGTSLVAQEISAYEGPFLEDVSGREVVNIAALHIYNTGEREVRYACITLQTEKDSYVFYGEHIPVGATVVLLEIHAGVYQQSPIKDCSGWQETTDQKQVDGLIITDKDNGTLVVTNTTGRTLYNLRLYYKSWLSPPGVYMGGISHCVTIPVLAPGQTEMVCPDRYATGYSKVVSVVEDPS
ncbi:MAG: hypothetical protein IKB80_06100 [Oscillospiraceae bacterium]|nr:hypothetical protein [Oscillospiraceae bacterium]